MAHYLARLSSFVSGSLQDICIGWDTFEAVCTEVQHFSSPQKPFGDETHRIGYRFGVIASRGESDTGKRPDCVVLGYPSE